MAGVLSVRGTCDGIRWGEIVIDGRVRRYQFDRLTGRVFLCFMWAERDGYPSPLPDLDPERLAAARAALVERLGVVPG